MGSLIRARCSCGYSSENLPEGHGFDPDRENRPARCDACRRVVTVDILLNPVRCPLCGGSPAEVYGASEDLHPDLNHFFSCPRCRRNALYLEPIGIWD